MNDSNNHEIKRVNLTFKEKIQQGWIDLKALFHDVMVEVTQKIQWIDANELFEHVKNFAIVAFISMICLFIIDNIIIYGLKLIF
jgi:hypothetical protein